MDDGSLSYIAKLILFIIIIILGGGCYLGVFSF
jgi:hypothetical protein